MLVVDGTLGDDSRVVIEQVGRVGHDGDNRDVAEQLREVFMHEVRVREDGSYRSIGEQCGGSDDRCRGQGIVGDDRPEIGNLHGKLSDECTIRIGRIDYQGAWGAKGSGIGQRSVVRVDDGQV